MIEVGIDVPNATVMLVEGADRFGLAQLHQFRGRVGRGGSRSYCLLLADESTPEGETRLDMMVETNDGFVLAEKDLELRGPGDFIGTRQSGLPEMTWLDGSFDTRLLDQARRAAERLLADDPDLLRPEHVALRERLGLFWATAAARHPAAVVAAKEHRVRVIAGEAKGHKLKGPPGPGTRPMADKIREALFSSLGSLGVEPERVLDLYAGTGSIGIEALSRSASWCDFVEQNPAACAVIRANLAHTKFGGNGRVHQMPVALFLARREPPYDFVILDPPYADPAIVETLGRVAASPLVQSGTVVAIGHSPARDAARNARPARASAGALPRRQLLLDLRDRPTNPRHRKGKRDDGRDLPGQLRPDHLRPHRPGEAGRPPLRSRHRRHLRPLGQAGRPVLARRAGGDWPAMPLPTSTTSTSTVSPG